MFGGYVGAAEVPAAGDVERDLKTEAVGFFERVRVEVGPLWAGEGGARGDLLVAQLAGAVGIYQQDSAEALGLHLLQVVGDGGLIGVAVKPPPVAAKAGASGWVGEAGAELGEGGRGGLGEAGAGRQGAKNR